MDKPLLLTTGPVPIDKDIQKIISQPLCYHRSPDFVRLFEEVTESLQYLLQTQGDVLILAASGTGGMEAVVTNLFTAGEKVIVVENGKFSERWSQIAKTYGLVAERLIIPWGQSPTATAIIEKINRHPDARAIFLTHCETSTGALTDLETMVPLIRQTTPALVIVDSISSAGILPLKMDDWGIDVIVTASQKGLGLPPGLAIVALNNRAWIYSELAELPRFYFDLIRARQQLRLGHGATFTPAIPLIVAARQVLANIKQQGIEAIWQQRKNLAERFRAQLSAAGFTLFPQFPADSLTVIRIDAFRNAKEICSILQEKHDIVVSRGQGALLDRVIRVGHMANIGEAELDYFLKIFPSVIQPNHGETTSALPPN